MPPEIMKEQLIKAYKAGYEKRICEQVDAAFSGEGQSSGYDSKALDLSAQKWTEKELQPEPPKVHERPTYRRCAKCETACFGVEGAVCYKCLPTITKATE